MIPVPTADSNHAANGGWPTLSFWNLDPPSKVGAPSFAATPGSPASGLGSLGWSSDGWVTPNLDAHFLPRR